MTFVKQRHIHDPGELAERPQSNQSQCKVTDGTADRELSIKIFTSNKYKYKYKKEYKYRRGYKFSAANNEQREIAPQNINHRGLQEEMVTNEAWLVVANHRCK